MKATQQDSPTLANIIYILYLVGLAVGITQIVGVVMAYISRGESSGWLTSHYTFQIRTFWIGLLMALIAIPLTFVFVGFALIVFYYVWLIIRCVKGMQYLSKQEEHPDPESWMFG